MICHKTEPNQTWEKTFDDVTTQTVSAKLFIRQILCHNTQWLSNSHVPTPDLYPPCTFKPTPPSFFLFPFVLINDLAYLLSIAISPPLFLLRHEKLRQRKDLFNSSSSLSFVDIFFFVILVEVAETGRFQPLVFFVILCGIFKKICLFLLKLLLNV